MTTTNDHMQSTPENVVRLKVDGAQSGVNTISEQKNGRGMSLICPFPALAVTIPVAFSGKDGQERSGTIHRIGVEDDPETGLPRLRLSVRSDEGEEFNVDQISTDATVAALQSTSTSSDSAVLAGLLQDVAEPSTQELLSLDELDNLDQSSGRREPTWDADTVVASSALRYKNAQTTRRRRVQALAAWAVVLVVGSGGGWVLNNAGIVDFSPVSDFVADMTGRDVSRDHPSMDALDQMTQTPAVASRKDAMATATTSAPRFVDVAGNGMNVIDDDEEVMTKSQDETADETAAEDRQVDVFAADEGDNIIRESQIVLPTRWPAEYSTSYRLRDPNGVVVDIPGGLVQREGWLKIDDDDNIIKSVKAMQHENGARFVIYVKGDLPNFKTKPLGEGVRLSLYYETEDGNDTQKVASID